MPVSRQKLDLEFKFLITGLRVRTQLIKLENAHCTGEKVALPVVCQISSGNAPDWRCTRDPRGNPSYALALEYPSNRRGPWTIRPSHSAPLTISAVGSPKRLYMTVLSR